MRRVLCLLGLLLLAANVQAAAPVTSTPPAASVTLQPLTVDSLPTLQDRFSGERHAVIYWSLTCVPCRDELAELGKVSGVGKLPISLVNTDAPSQIKEVQSFLARHHLGELDNWLFADAIPERLRQAIDGDWYGELPRSYAINRQGQRVSHSGKTDIARLVHWLSAR